MDKPGGMRDMMNAMTDLFVKHIDEKILFKFADFHDKNMKRVEEIKQEALSMNNDDSILADVDAKIRESMTEELKKLRAELEAVRVFTQDLLKELDPDWNKTLEKKEEKKDGNEDTQECEELVDDEEFDDEIPNEIDDGE